jgi:hypothetical protein
MASPATGTWWSTFLGDEGIDSEEEAAFLGFLVTQGIPAGSAPDTLQRAYADFRTFMEASEQRASADAGPGAVELAAEQARVAIQQRTIPKSRVAAPGVDKPVTAATRPPETRQPLGDAPPPPTGEAQLAPPGEEPAATPAHVTPPQEPERHEAPHGRGGRSGRDA